MKESKLEKTALTLRARALKIKVTDKESFDRAKKGIGVLKELEAEIRATFDPVVETANKAHKAAIAARKKHLEPVQEAKQHLSGQAGAYVDQQRRIREEAERKLREAQEAEEKRLQALADEKIRQAEEAAAAGDQDKAAEILEDDETKELPPPQPIPTAPLPPPPITAGLRTTTTWKAVVINERLVPREYMTPDLKKIGAFAREHKENAKMPGVKFEKDVKTG